MTTTPTRVVGDTNDTVVVTCGGVDTLLGYTAVEAHIWRTTTPASTADLEAVVTDAAALTVLVKLGSWINTATPGTWRLEVEVTAPWTDGQTGPRTFPSTGGLALNVRAAGG